MTFTETQMTILSAWERNFHTAVNADWASNPGRASLRTIYDIYTSATGDTRRYNDNCSHCILNLLRDCGKIYFRDKEELAQAKERKKVVTESNEVKKVVRKAVKTAKKGKILN